MGSGSDGPDDDCCVLPLDAPDVAEPLCCVLVDEDVLFKTHLLFTSLYPSLHFVGTVHGSPSSTILPHAFCF